MLKKKNYYYSKDTNKYVCVYRGREGEMERQGGSER